MNIVCAQCGAGVGYALPSLADHTVVACPGCRSGLRVRIEAFAIPAAAAAPETSPSPPTNDQRQRVVVALQGEATRELIGELLSGAGFEVIEAATGADALVRVSDARPALVLVDVGLSDIMGFQVCERIRNNAATAGVKIILVAAIHNKDRYRRQPGQLFGADDYIERHQIETDLVTKVKALCEREASASEPSPEPHQPERVAEAQAVAAKAVAPAPVPPPSARPQPSAPAASRVAPPSAPTVPPAPAVAKEPSMPPVQPPAPSASKTDDPVVEAARRLARIIVSDIALYNAKKVDEGVVKGTFFELLRAEIDEGRRLYEERRDPSFPATADLFQQTLEQFVATRRELLNRNRQAAA
ncbi:MAG: response regulator [Nitrospirota bacterium]